MSSPNADAADAAVPACRVVGFAGTVFIVRAVCRPTDVMCERTPLFNVDPSISRTAVGRGRKVGSDDTARDASFVWGLHGYTG
ncbi:hypothetical protein EVAR_80895_1 [Eumeta japonica]|uniref:Uncharacterized protein n=1 Tax=Eumeta variegata TaxID=151549 RepID=A0A4C1V065_EUMVA|nr:hypothetical protein EVAR_80895_1 [Eumeta japonica]